MATWKPADADASPKWCLAWSKTVRWLEEAGALPSVGDGDDRSAALAGSCRLRRLLVSGLERGGHDAVGRSSGVCDMLRVIRRRS